jgi:hypothetical protein
MIAENPLAAGFGAAGLACQLTWPLFRARRSILRAQLGIGVDYGVQYALLDAWTGAGVAGLGAAQTLVALCAGERPWLRRLGLAFLPLVAAVCWATWTDVESLFAFLASCLVMLGRLQQDTIRLRALLLAAAPFGIGYDVVVGALPAMIGAITSALIAATMLVREIRRRRRSRAVASK